jgi:hypothetical protein
MARGRSHIYSARTYPCLCVCLFACKSSASRPEQAWRYHAFSRACMPNGAHCWIE